MTRHELYWLGYRSGRNLAAYVNEHGTLENHERRLQVELRFSGQRRAYAVGELRGYRTARHD